MTREELIKKLKSIAKDADEDREAAHNDADGLLLEFINDKEITDAYNLFDKWYA